MLFFTYIGFELPKWVNSMKVFEFDASPLAALFLLSLTILANRGSKSAGNFNNIITITKLSILGFIILVSMWYFDSSNFQPFMNEEKGFGGVIEASTILFFGYLGFDFITTIAEEALNPIRDVPKAILYSVVLSMVIYVIITFAVSGVGKLAHGHGGGETALADIFE